MGMSQWDNWVFAWLAGRVEVPGNITAEMALTLFIG